MEHAKIQQTVSAFTYHLLVCLYFETMKVVQLQQLQLELRLSRYKMDANHQQ